MRLRLGRLLGDRGRRAASCSFRRAGAEGVGDGVDAVLDEAEAGDAAALPAARDVGRWIGIGLAGLVNILNPRLVILGGPLDPAPAPRRGVKSTPSSSDDAPPASRAQRPDRQADLGVDAPLLGAAELAFEPLLADPAAWLGRPRPRPSPGERLMGNRHFTSLRRRSSPKSGDGHERGLPNDVAYAPEASAFVD